MKYILVFFLILVGLRLLFRLLFPFAIKQMVNKQQKRASTFYKQSTNSRSEGEIRIENKNYRNDSQTLDVDYEEVK
jgi:hypothetical protein